MYRVLKQNIYFVPGTETVLCFSPVRFYAALIDGEGAMTRIMSHNQPDDCLKGTISRQAAGSQRVFMCDMTG
jgi:hypothetical protein